ncbi:MAG: TolC family protein [Gammaproteobacteria bacterium]|nr:TolC family protein [Gammaproteobacteria bacterium]
MSKSFLYWRGVLPITVAVLSGCASFPADLGRSDVDALVTERGQAVDGAASMETSAELLAALTATPLTPERVIRIALVNSPRLKASYAMLGFAAADVYEAGRIRNPIFIGALLDSDVSGERDQLTLGLVMSFTDLITLPARKRLSAGAFVAMKQSIGAEVLEVAAQAEMAYYGYVGAQQVAALRAQIANAGALSAALAERYHDAGNISARELAFERAAASEARLDALEAEAESYAARTALAGVLGLSVGDTWDAAAQLHLPLANEDELDTLIALAHQSRLDLAAARTQVDVLADRLGVVNWTRWLGELDVGVERERETDGARITGPTLAWEVPIFTQHKDAVLRAEADLQIAIAEVQRIATDVDNGVRLAYATLENAKARVTEYRNGLIPQRVEAVARAQEEVNFMLIGIFELIAIKQQEYDAYQGYLEAIRDYWHARVKMKLATGNSLPSSAQIGDQRIDVEDFIRPQPGGMDHSGHGSMPDHSSMKNDSGGGSESMDHSDHQTMDENSSAPDSKDHTGHKMTDADEVSEAQHETDGAHREHNDGGSQ